MPKKVKKDDVYGGHTPKQQQITITRQFGVQRSTFGAWLKTNTAFQSYVAEQKRLYKTGSIDKDQMTSNILRKITGNKGQRNGLRYEFYQAGGQKSQMRKPLSTKASLKAFFRDNGVNKVSSKALKVFKIIGGSSPLEFMQWHRNRFGKKDSISQAEGYLFLSERVAPHLKSAIAAQKRHAKKSQSFNQPIYYPDAAAFNFKQPGNVGFNPIKKPRGPNVVLRPSILGESGPIFHNGQIMPQSAPIFQADTEIGELRSELNAIKEEKQVWNDIGEGLPPDLLDRERATTTAIRNKLKANQGARDALKFGTTGVQKPKKKVVSR